MSAIDKATMGAAREAAGKILYAQTRGEDIANVIARAILAERQRCADVARRYLEDIAGCDMNDDEPDKIAAAVLDPTWQSPPL